MFPICPEREVVWYNFLFAQSICLENNDILKYQYNYLNRHINREVFFYFLKKAK